MAATMMTRFLQANTAADFAMASAVVLGGAVVARVAASVYERRIRARLVNSGSRAVEILPRLIDGSLIPFLYLASLYAGVKVLDLPAKIEKMADAAGIVALAYFGARFAVQFSVYALENYRTTAGEAPATAFKGLAPLVKTVIWGLCAIFILDNLGFNVSTVVAGLGIGGVALALASQAILGDLFSYFVILFDRPFEAGDFIAVGDTEGTVESVGIKTTRIRSPRGEEIVMSNTALTSARLHNLKRMTRRRVFVKIGVLHDTPIPALREIPSVIENVAKGFDGLSFERAHFATFGDNALVFELVYYVESPDYKVFMDRQQEVNFRLAEEFKTRGIVFAHPAQPVYLTGGKPA